MAGEDRVLAGGAKYIDFQTDPSRYRHWKLGVDGDVATLTMDVDENAGLFEGYQLKLNSYDLGVDIELADAVQRLRFEHPGGEGGGDAFGQEPRVLRRAPTSACWRAPPTPTRSISANSPTRPATAWKIHRKIPDSASSPSSTAPRPAAATNWRWRPITSCWPMTAPAAVSLPEVPLLAVLPGTGGLTRVVDKRKVRRDHADFFCTIEEGIKGKRAVAWRLVDEIVPNSKLEGKVADRAKEFAAASKRNGTGKGITLSPLNRTIDDSGIRYGFVSVDIDRAARIATISIKAPERPRLPISTA